MTSKITKISDLKRYLRQLMSGTGRPGDTYPRIQHAPLLDEETVVLVAGRLVMYADDDTIEVGVRTTMAGIKHEVNTLWFTVRQKPYAITYSKGRIEIRNRSKSGAPMNAIDKNTSPAIVSRIFAAL